MTLRTIQREASRQRREPGKTWWQRAMSKGNRMTKNGTEGETLGPGGPVEPRKEGILSHKGSMGRGILLFPLEEP